MASLDETLKNIAARHLDVPFDTILKVELTSEAYTVPGCPTCGDYGVTQELWFTGYRSAQIQGKITRERFSFARRFDGFTAALQFLFDAESETI